ncbi:GNAT family N-acetyltransferase [Devosia sp.]|uniref:GNAT family N-acetyltransferase n=1 Tax=Devosia sp. TaxID=1871048 RepID=UPI0025BF32F6|nr:GNAT family N-acetyltransferase [Devosia sp.]
MSHLRLRKILAGPIDAASWPTGIRPMELGSIDPRLAHAVLEEAFPGRIAPFADWHGNLVTDNEYDPGLCVAAVAGDGRVAGFIQCWTSNFIKDLAVAPTFRGRGIGAALMTHALGLFAKRGADYVDLKVEPENAAARRLYARLGMVEVPD